MSDNTGLMLSVGTPQSGPHNDLDNIDSIFKEMFEILEQAGISCKCIFLNADPGFDSEEMRLLCEQNEIELNVKSNKRNSKQESVEYKYFDDELYKRRTKIEHFNAWLNAFKVLLVRYEKKIYTWMALYWLAFSTRFLQKIKV